MKQMQLAGNETIWTIGHSTHSEPEFIEMLHAFDIQLLTDVRHFPGSKRYPHFNKEHLEKILPEQNIEYVHMKDLGGRRKASAQSVNTSWRSESFRGYADYMQTSGFKNAIKKIQSLALEKRVAYMCSEAVWWRCHRSLISDYLKSKGWTVLHIMSTTKAQEHPYTSAARLVNGELRYDPDVAQQGSLDLQ
jgi:uncharacterized protein (DUF488 family)